MGIEGSRVPQSVDESGPARALLLVGANYRTCSIDTREMLLRRATYPRLRRAVGPRPPWEDLVVLATCNRIELYVLTRDRTACLRTLCGALGLPDHAPALFVLDGGHAAAHLFRVASGLDSLAQGEGQITAQVRRAPEARPASWRKGTALANLFSRAAHAATRIRGLAGLDGTEASASHAAVRFVEQVVPVPRPQVVLLGTGKMARIGAAALRGRADLIVLNRDANKAREVARSLDGRGAGLGQLSRYLASADVLIAATSTRKPIVTARLLAAAAPLRGGRPFWLVDLGFPRNVDPRCARLPGVTVTDVDGLAPWGAKPLAPAAQARAEAAIQEEARRFTETLRPALVLDVAQFRRIAETVRREEVERALARMPGLTDADRAVVDKLAARLVNRFLHGPTERLRTLSDAARAQLVQEMADALRNAGGEGA